MHFYSSFQDESNLYMELEYIKGCTLLSQIVQQNAAVQSRADFYAAETIVTLQHLHKE